jgi:DMSO/TMAO reductase YedYZ molybdopterin-dependent catalytic subunit
VPPREVDLERTTYVSRGFRGRRAADVDPARVPPGQYVTRDFPVLSAGPTPRIDTATWQFSIVTESGRRHDWSWDQLMAMPAEEITVDLHCVTKWSKLGSGWKGVPVESFFEEIETAADFALAQSYGGYTTNLPLDDLLDSQAWIAYEYDGEPLAPVHGGPARLLVPHLYLWKSAKWIRGIQCLLEDEPGFWETAGYHDYGDPWREQRYQGD